MIVLVVVKTNQRHRQISAASRVLGSDLIRATNSVHLVRMSPFLKARLEEMLASPTQLTGVVLGDEPSPAGDGSACSRLVLKNAKGERLLIRLRQAGNGKFEVVGFRSVAR